MEYKEMNIKFRVEGRPPKKDGSQSLWSEKSHQAKLVFNLREKAFEAKQDAKIKESYSGLVQIKISIFAPFITINDHHQHVGDLDNLVAGIFESIQPASNNETLIPNKIFDQNPDVAPNIALLIDDDSQIVSISAEKIKSDDEYYTVEIESKNH
jgi:Holliday junction resolvase RusA-like endonuclease